MCLRLGVRCLVYVIVSVCVCVCVCVGVRERESKRNREKTETEREKTEKEREKEGERERERERGRERERETCFSRRCVRQILHDITLLQCHVITLCTLVPYYSGWPSRGTSVHAW